MKEVNIKESPDLPGGIKAHLESSKEYKKRLFSLHIMYFTVFLMSLAFGISLTGVWPYLHQLDKEAEKEFMGYVVAANPFGQMLFSPLIGMWANRIGSTKLPFIVTLVIFILSSGAYSSLELFTTYRRYWMLTTRLFIGISAANMAICRSYVSAATTLKERTGAVSMLSIAQVLGFIIGPGLQAGVTPLGDEGYPIIEGKLTMNMYTAVGWINVMFGLLNLLLLIIFFEEMPIAAKEVMYLSGAKSEKAAWKGMKLDYISVWTLIIGFFILTLNFVLLETLGVTLSMDQFAWTTQEALKFLGILLTVGGVFACITTAFIKPICKWFNEVKVLLWGGFLLMFIGRAIYIPWGSTLPVIAYDHGINSTVNSTLNSTNEPLGCPVSQDWCLYTPAMTITQYLLGFFLTCIGYPLGITLIQTIFSKVLGPRPQGVWMGLMTGSGCLSRVAGPVMVSYLYTRLGTIWTFGSTAIMMLFAMVWLGFVQKRLQLCYIKNTKLDSNFEAQKEEEMIEMNRGDS